MKRRSFLRCGAFLIPLIALGALLACGGNGANGSGLDGPDPSIDGATDGDPTKPALERDAARRPTDPAETDAAKGDAAVTDATNDGSTAVDAGPSAPVTAIALGLEHSCAILDGGRVKCWGANDYGQLGLGDKAERGGDSKDMGASLPVVDLGPGRTAKAVAVAVNHTCALLDNDRVKCWGRNFGNLGYGDTNERGSTPGTMGANLPYVDLGPGRTVKSLSAGAAHTCALLDTNEVKCWGLNNLGQLGIGSTLLRGDGPNQMGASLLAVDLGPGRTVKSLVAGYTHNCVILDTDAVKCWGANSNGNLGIGSASLGMGDAPNELGNKLPTADLGSGRVAKLLAASEVHSCAVLDDDTLKCWGGNFDWQLGLGDTLSRGDAPNEMGNSLPTVYLGVGLAATAAGRYHTCAVISSGLLKCWGDNAAGQLGLGDTIDRGTPFNPMATLPPVNVGPGLSVKAVAAGAKHTCAIVDDGRLKCWGKNDRGQLGLGDKASHGNALGSMGSALPFVAVGL